MPYELWHNAEQTQQATTQAFIFDGWSHEPLVIDRVADTHTAQHSDEPTAADRKTVRSFA